MVAATGFSFVMCHTLQRILRCSSTAMAVSCQTCIAKVIMLTTFDTSFTLRYFTLAVQDIDVQYVTKLMDYRKLMFQRQKL